MDSLFIPPPGAMQFEITQGWDGTPCPELYKPFVVWVAATTPYGPKDAKPDCPHVIAYAILKNLLSPLQRRGIGDSDKVCECVGRIIE